MDARFLHDDLLEIGEDDSHVLFFLSQFGGIAREGFDVVYVRYCVYREGGFFVSMDQRALFFYTGEFGGRRVLSLQGGFVRSQFSKSERGDLRRDVFFLFVDCFFNKRE